MKNVNDKTGRNNPKDNEIFTYIYVRDTCKKNNEYVAAVIRR